jgi:hypothetical protein
MKTNKRKQQFKQTEFEFTKKIKRRKPYSKEKRRVIDQINDEETFNQLEFGNFNEF